MYSTLPNKRTGRLLKKWNNNPTYTFLTYMVFHIEMFLLHSVWQIELCKSDFVWRWFWNAEIKYFFALQPVFVKFLLCALYCATCDSPSVSFGFCSILSYFFVIFLLILSLYESYTTVNDNWLHYRHIFLFYFCCYSTSFCCTSEKWIVNLFSKALQKLVKVLQKPNIMLNISSQLSFQIVCHSYRLRIKK